MKYLKILLLGILLFTGCATTHTTSRHILLDYNSEGVPTSPIKSMNITQITTTTRIRNYSNLFPIYHACLNGDIGHTRDAGCYIGANLILPGVPLVVDIISFIPLFLHDLIVPKNTIKEFKYEAKLSMHGKVVDKENNPVRNLKVPCDIIGAGNLNQSFDCQIITGEEGAFDYNIATDYTLPYSKQDNIKPSNIGIKYHFPFSNLYKVEYSYPFNESTTYMDKDSNIKKSKIKAIGNVIYGNFLIKDIFDSIKPIDDYDSNKNNHAYCINTCVVNKKNCIKECMIRQKNCYKFCNSYHEPYVKDCYKNCEKEFGI